MTLTMTDAKRIRPLGPKVLVKQDEAKAKTKGGIVLPDNAKDKPRKGTVTEVGRGKLLENGTTVPPQVQPGDRVIFSQYAGTEVKLNDVAYLLIEDSDILAIVEGEELCADD